MDLVWKIHRWLYRLSGGRVVAAWWGCRSPGRPGLRSGRLTWKVPRRPSVRRCARNAGCSAARHREAPAASTSQPGGC